MISQTEFASHEGSNVSFHALRGVSGISWLAGQTTDANTLQIVNETNHNSDYRLHRRTQETIVPRTRVNEVESGRKQVQRASGRGNRMRKTKEITCLLNAFGISDEKKTSDGGTSRRCCSCHGQAT